MRRILLAVGVCLILPLTTGCGAGGSGGGNTGGRRVDSGGSTLCGSGFLTALSGTWTLPCNVTDPTYSMRFTYTFSGTSWSYIHTEYENGSCTGAGTPYAPYARSGSLVVGDAVTVDLGGTPVTGCAINFTTTTGVATVDPFPFDAWYIDTTSTPRRLYFGISDPTHDGSTAALRPVALQDSYWEPQ